MNMQIPGLQQTQVHEHPQPWDTGGAKWNAREEVPKWEGDKGKMMEMEE